MGLNIELLQESFAALAPQGQRLADTFYGHLFHDYPQVKPMFENTSMAEQKNKLLATLKLAVDNLRRPDILVPALEQLGARHVDYGTLPDHYPAVGATLLKSLAEVAGELWSDELEQAWADVYGVVAEHMLAGAAAPVT